MSDISNVDLWHDASIGWYVKNEVVTVRFATKPGVVMSSVGPNQYSAQDALITGSNGDQWAVTPDRFRQRYAPISGLQMGQDGDYRNIPVAIKAKQMPTAFSVHRSAGADILRGQAGDWLVQYSPIDYGIVDQQRFAAVYQLKI